MELARCRSALFVPLFLLELAGPAPAEPPPAPPELRLPRTVVPLSNEVSLVLDATKETFSGRIEIAALATEPVRFLWLNAQNLTFGEATVTTGGKSSTLEVFPQEADFVGLRASHEIPAGPLTVTISYEGQVNSVETEGIFRQQEGGRWYAYTQFEPIAARRAFPCFDEPDSKVPWQLTLEVPEGQTALSNTPAASEKQTDRGTRIVAFQKTKPLPSYLIAFAVGPFDIVDAGKTRRGTPVRVVVPRGRSGDVGYVVDTTTPILALLEDYFASPYPFTKLDLLAIPLTVGFGAMENPGLVTFNQRLLTARREDFTINYQRRYAGTTAHELAHQWFGDLVTLAWWDDLWLNEAFATWMAGRIIDRWRPEWTEGVGDVTRRSSVMGRDGLSTARKIRQTIGTTHDIRNAFDGITYSKGASVIRMFEHWIGEDRFRDGVRAYVHEHAWRNATASDFLRAVGQAAGRDIARPFSTFLEQVGAPLISFDLACEQPGAPILRLEQRRYLPLGSQADPHLTWQVPVCVRYPTGQALARDCLLMTDVRAELPLTHTKSCPAWILPNEDGLGYYRSELRGELLERLLDEGMREISLPERVGVIGDVNALVAAGGADIGLALGLAARFAHDENRHVVSAVAGIADGISDSVPDELRPHYARFIGELFGERARKLGWTPGKEEDDDTRLLRDRLLGLVTEEGEDRALAAEARTLAAAWLDDRSAIDPDMVSLVLGTAALYGDRALFDRFYEEAKRATDRRDRQRLLSPLGYFRDPELAKRALGLLLTDDFDIREASTLIGGALENPRNRRMVYDFVKQNYDALVAKMPKTSARTLVTVAVSQCDASLQEDAESFFKDRISALPGGPRVFAQAMEQLDLCVKRREAQAPGIARFLREQ